MDISSEKDSVPAHWTVGGGSEGVVPVLGPGRRTGIRQLQNRKSAHGGDSKNKGPEEEVFRKRGKDLSDSRKGVFLG